MLIRRLAVVNFRNIQQAQLTFSPGCNFFLGENGAGKTAFLEAIDILSRRRTFRTHYTLPLIRNGQETCMAEATLVQGQTIQIKKSRQFTQVTVNGQKVNSRAESAALLPVQVLHPDSHVILQGGAKNQQAFLDWGVFHMKPTAVQSWVAYQKGLKQRNHLLKQAAPKSMIDYWDQTIIENAEKLHLARYEQIRDLTRELKTIETKDDNMSTLQMEYQPGWPAGESLTEALAKSYRQDLRRGCTQVGPHRATIRFILAGVDAAKQASRGQQKMLIAGLLLAQATLLTKRTGKPCLLVVDDFSAEIDEANQRLFLRQIQTSQLQALISMTADTFQMGTQTGGTMFHVKHGHVTGGETTSDNISQMRAGYA